MNDTYRVRIKKGDLEIEIESSEKEYLDNKLKEILENDLVKQPHKYSKLTKTNKTIDSKQALQSRRTNKKRDTKEDDVDITGLISFIKDQDEYSELENNILNKRDRLPKILMCFYYADEYFETPYLTTGHIEKITDQFAAKVKTSNVSTVIKENLKFFNQDQVRKKGAKMRYKLNRTGRKEFESYLIKEN